MTQYTLKRLLDASNIEYVDGYEVEAYHYPTTMDATVVLSTVDDLAMEFDQQQLLHLDDNGGALAYDIHGEGHVMAFRITRPLCHDDLRQ